VGSEEFHKQVKERAKAIPAWKKEYFKLNENRQLTEETRETFCCGGL
jgi:hypothetical protein